MRIVSFISDVGTIREILDHLGESAQPPSFAAARGQRLWETAMASVHMGNDPE
jgi:hypothetical protein